MENPYLHCFPYLDNLVGGWFHADYHHEGDTLESLVNSYRSASPADDLLGTKADIMRFLRFVPEERVETEFQRLFKPGLTFVGWFSSTKEGLLAVYGLL